MEKERGKYLEDQAKELKIVQLKREEGKQRFGSISF